MNFHQTTHRPFSLDFTKFNPNWLLLIGIGLMAISHMTWNVDALAWVAMVPFLLYLNVTEGRKARLRFVLALTTAWHLAMFKIISDPIPLVLSSMYAIPITLIHVGGYLLYDKVKTHKLALLLFPAIMVILEWAQYTFTPLASWGIAAYTQVDSLNIAQSISLFGMAGLSFLIYWTNAAITDLLINRRGSMLNLYAPLSLVVLFSVYGHLRLDLSRTTGEETLKVAAVGTDSEIAGMPLPAFEEQVEDIHTLFDRTAKAAERGAQIVVWNEGSFFLPQELEAAWQDSMSQLAAQQKIALTASYVVPVSFEPFLYENKLVLFDPNGAIQHTYLKHQPVPSEPAVQGTEKIIAVDLFDTQIGGAICYDYDFPYLARENGKAEVDILTLPSSDWRGIDPIHTQMASFRAIEQGHAVIRSTRFGLSAIMNPTGEMVGKMSSFDSNDKILVANVVKEKAFTLYSVVGDVLVYLCIVFVAGFVPFFYSKKKPSKQANQEPEPVLT